LTSGILCFLIDRKGFICTPDEKGPQHWPHWDSRIVSIAYYQLQTRLTVCRLDEKEMAPELSAANVWI